MIRTKSSTRAPLDDFATFQPDLQVADQVFAYTGLRDAKGRRILKRVTEPVGFLRFQHHGVPYAVEPENDGYSDPTPSGYDPCPMQDTPLREPGVDDPLDDE